MEEKRITGSFTNTCSFAGIKTDYGGFTLSSH